MVGAIKASKWLVENNKIPRGGRVVVLLADSTRNYMTKFLSDEWMKKYNFEPTKGEGMLNFIYILFNI